MQTQTARKRAFIAVTVIGNGIAGNPVLPDDAQWCPLSFAWEDTRGAFEAALDATLAWCGEVANV